MKDSSKPRTKGGSSSTASNRATDKEKRQLQLNRERQRRYRQRALKDPDGLLLTRLQVMISPGADGCLTRICKTTGMTKREAIEKALVELERNVTVTDG
jgi:hypothetical protein